MSNFYLVNQDNPAAISMAEKLIASIKDKCYIACTSEELDAFTDGEVYEVPESKPGTIPNPYVHMVEVDKDKEYLALCKGGFISPAEAERLGRLSNVTLIFTH